MGVPNTVLHYLWQNILHIDVYDTQLSLSLSLLNALWWWTETCSSMIWHHRVAGSSWMWDECWSTDNTYSGCVSYKLVTSPQQITCFSSIKQAKKKKKKKRGEFSSLSEALKPVLEWSIWLYIFFELAVIACWNRKQMMPTLFDQHHACAQGLEYFYVLYSQFLVVE